MKSVFVAADNIITSLGFSTEENWQHLQNGKSGIARHDHFDIAEPIFASLVDTHLLENFFEEQCRPTQPYTRFEKLAILSIRKALENSNVDVTSARTRIILSSTKGSIDLLANKYPGIPEKRVGLAESAKVIQQYFKNPHTPLVISNACISGVLAIAVGKHLAENDDYDHVIITGADIVSDFVVAGFQSLKALADEPCRPYDAERKGLNLGEGCATVMLSGKQGTLKDDAVYVLAGASGNDANHISGPSRDGEGLYQTIRKVLESVNSTIADNIHYISAHGTATLYNDEMESHAISRSGLAGIPLNSLKGYFGHTLGVAGVIESVIAMQELKHDLLLKSYGYDHPGVSNKINVIKENRKVPITNCLKIASGFGGCNAGIILSRGEN